jgi:hypothetical protein
MAQPSAFTGGRTFPPGSRITFNYFNFITTAIGEFFLPDFDTPVVIGVGPTLSITARSKVEKQRLKRCVATLWSVLIMALFWANQFISKITSISCPFTTIMFVRNSRLSKVTGIWKATSLVNIQPQVSG